MQSLADRYQARFHLEPIDLLAEPLTNAAMEQALETDTPALVQFDLILDRYKETFGDVPTTLHQDPDEILKRMFDAIETGQPIIEDYPEDANI